MRAEPREVFVPFGGRLRVWAGWAGAGTFFRRGGAHRGRAVDGGVERIRLIFPVAA
jgi:hypothetical protein